ncbi:DNA-binding response regulator [Marinicella pacifica]|uniref:DNA-binding response regulator n=1 Tax=Marinicella pacifica TaxID=1171543 RepID=A0A917FS51_9GAMM|nr:LytTR family DNA-binding domain-containing protein [Marinicella pacifica]GGG03360.1 DNA-binding response regulator [Marinicella pacifica]
MNTKNHISALIIDDSRLARQELKHLLNKHPEIQIEAEASDAEQALAFMKNHNVDVLFLDIQMPGKDGFELLQQLDQVPQVVFVTAYDEYAIKAFQHNALDYLQKPIEPEALDRAVSKIVQQHHLLKAQQPSEKNRETLGVHDQVFVKDGEQCWFVTLGDIRLFEVSGNYTTLYFDDNSPMLNKTLNQLAERLDDNRFFRANRNQLINLNHIQKVEPWIQGIRVHLSGGETIELSRRQTQQFKEVMSL